MTEQKLKELQEAQGKRLKNSTRIIFIGAIAILVAPYVLTRDLGLIDFTATGTIGDTIGGVTAPIVNFVAALLVYHAFKAQIDANNIILIEFLDNQNDKKIASEKEYIFKLYELIKEEIQSFSVIPAGAYQQPEKHLRGSKAIEIVIIDLIFDRSLLDKNRIKRLDNLLRVLWLFEDVLDELGNVKILKTDRKVLSISLRLLYDSYIEPALSAYTDIDENSFNHKYAKGDRSILMNLESRIESKFEQLITPTPPSSTQNAQ